MLTTIEAAAAARRSNIEAEDAITPNWTEEAEAAVEQFEQPYITCVIGWQLGDAGARDSNIEAEDAITPNWTEEAEAAVEQFEQPYISCTLGWGGLETSTDVDR